MKRVLITGGAGFIGFRLAQLLAPQVEELVLCDYVRLEQADDEFKRFLAATPHARFVSADLLVSETFTTLGAGYDTVFHLAATVGVEVVENDPIRVVKNNIYGTVNLLEWFAASGSRRLVFSSTSEVYAGAANFGILPIPTSEAVPAVVDNIFHPRSSYAISKLAGEHLVAQYARLAGTEFSVIRYHNVYGPRMGFKHVVPQMMRRLAGGENPFVVRSASHMRAFCYVDDAVAASIAVARCPAAHGRIIHIGNSHEHVTILELTRLLCEVMNFHPDLQPAEEQLGSVAKRCPDTSLLASLTGPMTQVRLSDGLARTYQWYRTRL